MSYTADLESRSTTGWTIKHLNVFSPPLNADSVILAMKKIVSEQQRHQELNYGPEALEQTKVKFNINNESSPRNNLPALPLMWDSLESDTESLVQEKEYQRGLQMRVDLSAEENPKHHEHKTDSEEPEGLDVYDSLDLKPKQVKGPPKPQR